PAMAGRVADGTGAVQVQFRLLAARALLRGDGPFAQPVSGLAKERVQAADRALPAVATGADVQSGAHGKGPEARFRIVDRRNGIDRTDRHGGGGLLADLGARYVSW